MEGSRARVLLVEDDVSIRRFVALALEDLPVDLVRSEEHTSELQSH